jgi:hypothetical protein
MTYLSLSGVVVFAFGGALILGQLLSIFADAVHIDPVSNYFIGFVGFGFVGLGLWLITREKTSNLNKAAN